MMTNGAIGGTGTSQGAWALARAVDKNEGLDMIIWDYSSNDLEGGLARKIEFFIERARTEFAPDLVAVLAVFWRKCGENARPWCQDTSTSKKTTTNQLYMPFHDSQVLSAREPLERASSSDDDDDDRGRLAVLTMGLPLFCADDLGGCHSNDFVQSSSAHPTGWQYANFAELVIWQLCAAFEELLAQKNCAPFSSGPPPLVLPKTLVRSALRAEREKMPRVLAFFLPFSPLSGRAPPVSEVALLCAPALRIPNNAKPSAGEPSFHNVFDDSAPLLLPGLRRRPLFVPISFAALLYGSNNNNSGESSSSSSSSGCAGWNIISKRSPARCDEKYAYSPASTPACPLGTKIPPHQPRYPNKTWAPDFPMVKMTDPLLRINATVYGGKALCAGLFLPDRGAKFLVRHRREQSSSSSSSSSSPSSSSSSWEELPATVSRPASNIMGLLCSIIPKTNASYVYAWCPSDICFGPRQFYKIKNTAASIFILDSAST